MAVADTARIGYTNALKSEIARKDLLGTKETWVLSLGSMIKYDTEDISSKALDLYRMVEMCSMVEEKQKILLSFDIARSSTIEILKKQVVAEKAGLLLGEE